MSFGLKQHHRECVSEEQHLAERVCKYGQKVVSSMGSIADVKMPIFVRDGQLISNTIER